MTLNPVEIQSQIWKVTLVGHDCEAYLKADFITSFCARPDCILVPSALHGNYYARGETMHDRVEIYDWSKSTASTYYRAVIFLEEEIVRSTCM